MLRLTEIAMFLAPFILFGVWWVAAARGIPSTATVTAAAGALIILLAALLWFSQEGAMPGDSAYVPAQLQDGRILPGHAAP